jgi:S1-C subfamily serine protease
VRAGFTGAPTPRAPVVATDQKNDLALLLLPSPPSALAAFREGRGIRLGDGVVTFGFPLRGVLASAANLTTGTVSALAGLGDDSRYIQITAPVQPGNSGGPLLDASGNVVGVVVGKLDALAIARKTGDIPQNVNFAINASVARAFLDANGVDYETRASSQPLQTADVGERARAFTAVVECWK